MQREKIIKLPWRKVFSFCFLWVLAGRGDAQLVFLNVDSEVTTPDRSPHDLPY
jgi:hypothetical protein